MQVDLHQSVVRHPLLWSFALLCICLSTSLNAAQDKVRLRLVWKNQFQFAGYYVAKEKGFYQQEGLEVEILESDNEIDNVEEVLSGGSEFAVGRSSLLVNRVRGDDVVALFAAFQRSPMMLLTMGRSGLSTPASLLGKRVMVTSESGAESEILAMLMKSGVTPSDFIHQKHSYNLDDLVAGNTDAMSSYISNEPFQLQQQGLEYHVLSPMDHGFNMYSDILFTSGRLIREQPELVEKFYRASLRGWLYAFGHIEETAASIYNKYNTQGRSIEALQFEGETLKKLAFDKNGVFGSMTMSRLEQMLQVYRLTNIIDKHSDLTGLLYASPIIQLHITPKELEYLAVRRHLSVCVAEDWMPYEGVESGVYTGMVADFMHLLQQKIGLGFAIVPVKSMLQARMFLRSGECDIISAVIPTAIGSSYYEFTSSYLGIPAFIVMRSGADNGTEMPDSIAVISGNAFEEIIRMRHPAMEVVTVEDGAQGMSLLLKGGVKGMLSTSADYNRLVSEHQINGVTLNETVHEMFDLSVATKKGDLILVGLIDKAIRAITQEERQKITSRWINIKPPKPTIPLIVWQVLIAIALFIALMFYRYWIILRHNQELSRLAQTDWLTQVPNRQKVVSRLEDFINHCDRYSGTVSLIYFDIDDFKTINDDNGHSTGDRVLKTIAMLASGVTRKTDMFGRWGGEEFILAGQETAIQESVNIAEKLRHLIAQYDFHLPNKVTCSFGVAEYRKGESLEQLVNRADAAMYMAKRSGKNSVAASEDG